MDIQDSDAVYYRMREQHERDLAEKATVEEARVIHQDLAAKYGSLAEKAEGREPRGIENVAPGGLFASPST